jgi:hypothetical protein
VIAHVWVSKIALISPTIQGEFLLIDAPGMPTMKIPLVGKDYPVVPVSVWSSAMEGVDEGDEIASWLQKFLDQPKYSFRLIRTKKDHNRQVSEVRLYMLLYLTV